MVYKVLHENEYNVEVERSLCDFFPLPGNLITMHCLGTFNFIPENTKKDGKRRGSRILKTCVSTVLLNVCDACVLTPVDIQT